MKNKYSFKLIVPAVLFGMALSGPAFAQDSSASAPDKNAPASQQMDAAGHEMEQAGSDSGMAAKDAFHGTERATKDTAITADVKAKLASDKRISSTGIHVNTTAGVVTLRGSVGSPEMAQHAAQIAEQADGVKSVNNQLMVVSSASN
jgi:hyperosmotically inducible periplasmic protein